MFHHLPSPFPPLKIMTEQDFECLSTSCRFKNSETLVGKKGGREATFLQDPVVKYLSVCVVDIVLNHRVLKLIIKQAGYYICRLI